MTDTTLREPGPDATPPTDGPGTGRLLIPGGPAETSAGFRSESAGAPDRDSVDRSGPARIEQVRPEPEETPPEPSEPERPAPEPTSPGVVSAALHHPRTSAFVVLGLVLNVSAALTVLTGALAPVAIVLAGLGVLSSGIGLAATRKPHITGRVTALLSILLGIAVAVLAGAVLVGGIDWLDHPDQPARLRHWLHVHLPVV